MSDRADLARPRLRQQAAVREQILEEFFDKHQQLPHQLCNLLVHLFTIDSQPRIFRPNHDSMLIMSGCQRESAGVSSRWRRVSPAPDLVTYGIVGSSCLAS